MWGLYFDNYVCIHCFFNSGKGVEMLQFLKVHTVYGGHCDGPFVSVVSRGLLQNGACREHQAILVYAPEGSGKSVLLSRACHMALELFGKDTMVIMRYVGLTSRLKSRSQSLRDLLSSICTQLDFLLNHNMDLMKVCNTRSYRVATHMSYFLWGDRLRHYNFPDSYNIGTRRFFRIYLLINVAKQRIYT